MCQEVSGTKIINCSGQKTKGPVLLSTGPSSCVTWVPRLPQHPQREQAHGRVERRRLVEQLRGVRDVIGRYVDAGPGLVAELARQERL
jgi:hypothetical protein